MKKLLAFISLLTISSTAISSGLVFQTNKTENILVLKQNQKQSQKAEYKTEKGKLICTKIGYFTNDKGEIQIERFLPKIAQVPETLPSFITNLSDAFRSVTSKEIKGVEK